MRIHRGYLFWGIFFILLGAIPLADREGWLGSRPLGDVGRLWPLAIIAIGFAILVSRSRGAVLGTIIAALVFGGIAGGALARGGGWIFDLADCAPGERGDLTRTTRQGTLTDGSVTLRLNCGTLDVHTAPGDAWRLDAAYRGDPPVIQATTSTLSVRPTETIGRRQEWSVSLPQAGMRTLDVEANAGQATLDLAGVTLGGMSLVGNAADVRMTAPGSTLAGLDITINAGRARITLGGATSGSVSVNAGSLAICVPSDAALQLTVPEQFAFATNLDDRGLTRSGSHWERAGRGGPNITLSIEGNAANFDLDPSGGC